MTEQNDNEIPKPFDMRIFRRNDSLGRNYVHQPRIPVTDGKSTQFSARVPLVSRREWWHFGNPECFSIKKQVDDNIRIYQYLNHGDIFR